jgi:acyl-CoA hydrolase
VGGLKPPEDLQIVGEVSHYFSRVRAAVVLLKIPIAIGDIVRIKGRTTDFKQKVSSIQIDRQAFDKAVPGDEVGLLVESRVRVGDMVTKV